MKQPLTKITVFLTPVTALLGSCCALPLLLLALGLGSAGFVTALVPYKPYLVGATLLLLAMAFYLVYGCKEVCEGKEICSPKSIRRTKILLWIATGLAFLFLLGPEILARCLG